LKISLKEFLPNIPFVSIIFIIGINITIAFFPLTKNLGYEFSTINAIVLFFLSGLQAIKIQKKEYFINALQQFFQHKFLLLSFVLLPFLIGFLSSVLNSNCPLKGGIYFYLVITIPSIFFGAILGNLCFALSKKYAILYFIILFLVAILSVFIEFYFNPQIYFYNPIFGYFPGTIYDEDLSVDRILIAYRIFNLSFFISIYYFSKIIYNRRKLFKYSAIIILLIITCAFSYLKPRLLFASDKSRIENTLDSSITTNHFKIHLPKKIATEIDKKYIALLHEYYIDQIKNDLNIKFDDKIDSYLFDGRDSKRELLGSGSADIAKPWLNQIYLNYYTYEATLKHELVHILAGKFGSSLFKVSSDLSPAMIEGLAMSIENNYDDCPVHYMAKLAYQSNFKFSIVQLFNGLNFFSKTSSISYVFAGSFLKFLEDKYRVENIKKLYKQNDFEKIYGKDLNTLAKEYEDFINRYDIEFSKDKAQLYFGGTTIFKKYCPRMAASDARLASKLFRDKKYSESLQLFQNIYDYSNSY